MASQEDDSSRRSKNQRLRDLAASWGPLPAPPARTASGTEEMRQAGSSSASAQIEGAAAAARSGSSDSAQGILSLPAKQAASAARLPQGHGLQSAAEHIIAQNGRGAHGIVEFNQEGKGAARTRWIYFTCDACKSRRGRDLQIWEHHVPDHLRSEKHRNALPYYHYLQTVLQAQAEPAFALEDLVIDAQEELDIEPALHHVYAATPAAVSAQEVPACRRPGRALPGAVRRLLNGLAEHRGRALLQVVKSLRYSGRAPPGRA